MSNSVLAPGLADVWDTHMTIGTAAKRLGVTACHVYWLIRQSRFKAIKTPHGQWVASASLEAYRSRRLPHECWREDSGMPAEAQKTA